MTDLAAELEAADPEQADLRALSDEVLLALGWKRVEDDTLPVVDWWPPDNSGVYLNGTHPNPAASVDDGLVLLRELPGEWDWGLGHGLDIAEQQIVSCATIGMRGKQQSVDGFGATPALALSAALVRAAQAQKENDDA